MKQCIGFVNYGNTEKSFSKRKWMLRQASWSAGANGWKHEMMRQHRKCTERLKYDENDAGTEDAAEWSAIVQPFYENIFHDDDDKVDEFGQKFVFLF